MDFYKDMRLKAFFLFTLLMIVGSYVFLRVSSVSVELYVMMAVFFFVMFIGLIGGIERGLIASLIAIFTYSTYLIVLRLYFPWKSQFSVYDLFWIVSVPIGAWVGGGLHKTFYVTYESLRNMENRVQGLVSADEETGLDGRERFIYELQSEIERCKRYGGRFGFMLLQIQLLREFEGQYGGGAKRRLIKTVAERMNASLRLEDRKGRLSEDEFAAILLEVRHENADVVRKRLKERLAFIDLQVRPEVFKRVKVHLKVGISFYPEDGEDFPTLYNNAKKDFEFDVG